MHNHKEKTKTVKQVHNLEISQERIFLYEEDYYLVEF